MTAVAGTKFTNSLRYSLVKLSFIAKFLSLLKSRGGVARLSVISYVYVLDTIPLSLRTNCKELSTGSWMFACVSLPRNNYKARTKPLCLWD